MGLMLEVPHSFGREAQREQGKEGSGHLSCGTVPASEVFISGDEVHLATMLIPRTTNAGKICAEAVTL